MKRLDKDLIISIYSKLSVIVGLVIFLILFVYYNNLPEEMYGPIEKGIFNIDFNTGLQINLIVFNLPLIFFIGFFLYNLGMLIFIQTGKKIDSNVVTDSIFYNTILSLLLIVSQFAFVYMIPETINGTIDIGLFKYEFVQLASLSVTGINFGYILAAIYTFYSVFVLFLEIRRNEVDFK